MYTGDVHGAFDDESHQGSERRLHYVKRVPKDLIDELCKERYSISLRIEDPKEAKCQCGETDVQKEREFAALRVGPQPISFKDTVRKAYGARGELCKNASPTRA
jgi:hypothetical protein